MTNAKKTWRKSEETKLVEKVNEYLKTDDWDDAFNRVSADLGRTARGCKDRWNIIHARKRKMLSRGPYVKEIFTPTPITSNIEHPQHYNTGSKEVIDVMRDGMTPEQFEGFLVGNIIKYVMRYPNKNGMEDILKAKWYLSKLVEVKGQAYINNSEE